MQLRIHFQGTNTTNHRLESHTQHNTHTHKRYNTINVSAVVQIKGYQNGNIICGKIKTKAIMTRLGPSRPEEGPFFTGSI